MNQNFGLKSNFLSKSYNLAKISQKFSVERSKWVKISVSSPMFGQNKSEIWFFRSNSWVKKGNVFASWRSFDLWVALRIHAGKLRVRLGQFDIAGRARSSDDAQPVPDDAFYGVDKCIVHDGYHSETHLNDIAVLRLDRRVRFSDAVRRICLPPPSLPSLHGEQAYVAGNPRYYQIRSNHFPCYCITS